MEGSSSETALDVSKDMAVKFSPDGSLDVATDPSQLPAQVSDKDEVSGAMTRCTNLHLDRMGIASTRKGSGRINGTGLSISVPLHIVEQDGKRYLFGDDKIYENEVSIQTGMATAVWSSVKYNAFNSQKLNIFATNGTNRKRIENGTSYDWGVNAPDTVASISAGTGTGLTGTYNVVYTYCRKEGDTLIYESNPSEEATAVTLTNQSLNISVTPSNDPQINAIRIYRTDALGEFYYYLMTIDMPTSLYSYVYTYEFEEGDAYLSGTGYQLTRTITPTTTTDWMKLHDCDTMREPLAFWKHSRSRSYIDVDYSIYQTAPASIKTTRIGGANDYLVLEKDKGTWDLKEFTQLKVWLYVPSAVSDIILYMGESAYNEQTLAAFSLNAGWTQKTWDISGISETSKDAIKYFAIGSTAYHSHLQVDTVLVDKSTNTYENYRALYSWEPSLATSDPASYSTYYYETGISEDDTADSALGTEVEEDHDVPPYGAFVFGPSYNGILFILKDNCLCYSKEKRPEYWPSTYFLEVSPKDFNLISGCIYDGQPYVSTTEEIYLIQGTGHQTWSYPLAMSAITGTISQQCFLAIHGQGIFHLGNDGVYLHSGAKDQNITNSQFRPIFEGKSVGGIPAVDKTNLKNSWMIHFQGKLYYGYPQAGSEYPDNIMVVDLSTGRTVHYDYGITVPCVGIDFENDRLLAVDMSGYIWVLEDGDRTDDDGTAISWQIETKAYSDQLRKYFPRWARYDVNLGTGATANGYIILNDVSKQTHALTVSRKTRKRLITGCNGDRIAIRLTGTGPVDIYSVEVE